MEISEELRRLHRLEGRVDALTEYIMTKDYPTRSVMLAMLGKEDEAEVLRIEERKKAI